MSSRLRSNAQPRQWIPAIAAGLVTGSMVVIVAISFATLAYAGRLDQYVGSAIGLALAGSAICTIIIALTSTYPGIIANAQDSPAAIITLLVAAVVTQLGDSPDSTKFVTSVVAIMVATVLAGAFMFAIGTARLGRFVRYIPYPVIGGFLAGTGYLLFTGGFSVMTGVALSFDTLNAHFTPEMLLRWVPGLILAVIVLFFSRRFKHPLLLPGMVVGAIVVFFAGMLITGTSIERATELGLLIGPLPEGGMWQMPAPSELLAVDWNLIAAQAPQFATLIFLSILQMLLNSSGIELVAGCDMDLNQELRSAGMGNMAGGLLGGLPGYHSLSVTLLGHWMRANSRLIGITAGLVTVAAVFLGGNFLSVFPNALLGGFLVFLGLSLLTEWVYDAAKRLPLPEYLIVLLILIVIALRGYLEGVSFGVVAAVVLFLVQYSRQSVVKHALTNETYRSTVLRSAEEQEVLRAHGAETMILELQGYIFFGTANGIFEIIRSRAYNPKLPKLRHIVIDFRRVTAMDTSALLSYTRMKQIAENEDFVLVLTQSPPYMAKRLAFVSSIDRSKTIVHLLPSLDYGLEWCENDTLSRYLPRGTESEYSVETLLARQMSEEHVEVILRYLKRVDVPKDSVLVRQGDATYDLFFIQSGGLSVQLQLADGNTLRVRTVKAGSVLGEIGFYQRTERTASIVADETSVVYAMSPDALDQLCKEAPEAGAAMHRYLATILAGRLSESTALLRDALA
jgi:SulP family sulfate permease